MTEELKPCPFCGNKKILVAYEEQLDNAYDVYCVVCKCGAAMRNSIKEAAIEAWNKRYTDV